MKGKSASVGGRALAGCFLSGCVACIGASLMAGEVRAQTPPVLGPGVTGKDADFLPYIAKVQATLRDALCAAPQTRPGTYRLALQLRLNSRGAVERFRLLDTIGHRPQTAFEYLRDDYLPA
jgi:hypothetical protein